MQLSSPQYPGKLLVFEGGEGCGKTTQLELTYTWFQTEPSLQRWVHSSEVHSSEQAPLLTREPGGTELCGQIRRVLLEHHAEAMDPKTELLLYAADRAQHVEQCLRPALQRGQVVLCDRYTDSTVAYQGFGRALDIHLINQLNQIATNGLKPDLTLWLDLDVEVGLARAQTRGKRDRIEQSDLTFHQAVREGFKHLADTEPQRFVRIDASHDIATVSQQIQTAIKQAFETWGGPIK